MLLFCPFFSCLLFQKRIVPDPPAREDLNKRSRIVEKDLKTALMTNSMTKDAVILNPTK